MTAKGGDMPQGRVMRNALHYPARRDEGAEGHATAKRLGQADDIGCHTVFRHGEHLPRPTETGLYLIENQQGTHLVAATAQSLQIPLLRNPHPRLALHGLHEHAGRLFGNPTQILRFVEPYPIHTGQHRAVGVGEFPALHDAHRSVRGAVVRIAAGHHAPAARKAIGELQRPFHRFRTGIDEIDRIERCRQVLRDAGGIAHLRALHQLSVDHHVHVVAGLTAHGLRDSRIAVPHVTHRNPRDDVVITFSLRSEETHPLGTCHLHQHGRRRGLADMSQKLLSQYLHRPTPPFFSPPAACGASAAPDRHPAPPPARRAAEAYSCGW